MCSFTKLGRLTGSLPEHLVQLLHVRVEGLDVIAFRGCREALQIKQRQCKA
jgi:hypothetical protein